MPGKEINYLDVFCPECNRIVSGDADTEECLSCGNTETAFPVVEDKFFAVNGSANSQEEFERASAGLPEDMKNVLKQLSIARKGACQDRSTFLYNFVEKQFYSGGIKVFPGI